MHSFAQPPNVALSVFFLVVATSTAVTSFHFGKPPRSLPLPASLVYQFPKPTWIENLAVRSNGELLVTLLTTPDLYLIDPSSQGNPTLVHSFPSVLGLTGIAELNHDVFYVAGGNLSIALLTNTPGTYSVWEVDMRSFSSSGARVRTVTSIPEAGFLQGAVTLSTLPSSTILIADAALGGVWKVNVRTGDYSLVISDTTMNPVATAPFNFIGVDGIKIRHGHLYYSNFNQGIFYRIPISKSGTATGNAKVLAVGAAVDDFAFDRAGRVWIAQNTLNLVSLLENGALVPAVGATNQLTVAGVTSCAFGRGLGKGDLLYCTTSGGIANTVNGTVSEGGKVVVVETAGSRW